MGGLRVTANRKELSPAIVLARGFNLARDTDRDDETLALERIGTLVPVAVLVKRAFPTTVTMLVGQNGENEHVVLLAS